MARILDEKPLRRALSDVLAPNGETRVEAWAHRYKEALRSWSESTGVELAAIRWKERLKSRSEAPWIQRAAARYEEALRWGKGRR